MNISVVGQGYVGTAVAKAFMGVGHSIVGIETNTARLREIEGIGYETTSDYSRIKGCSTVIVAVQTPLDSMKRPDLSFLLAACREIRNFVDPGTLIVSESTSYPGTLRNEISGIFNSTVLLATAPERVDPGNEIWNIKNTPRVISGLTSEAQLKAVNLYKEICDEVIEVTSPEVAEAAKLFENTFRNINIALVNEFAQIASSLGISTQETLSAASSKPFGFMPFTPSLGVGGHCIPVDPVYLSFVAERSGVPGKLIRLADEINTYMPNYVAKKIDENFEVKGKTIQVAGIAYKSGVSDTRESPAISLIGILRSMGARVSWSDALVGQYQGEISTPISKVDIGVIATAHPDVDYSPWNSGVIVVDVSTAENLGWPKFL